MCVIGCKGLTSHVLQLTSSFSITMLFPFLPFLVEFLLPELDETAIGMFRTRTWWATSSLCDLARVILCCIDCQVSCELIQAGS